MRIRRKRVAWMTCDDCCKSITKIAKSIHGYGHRRCKCGSWKHRKSMSLTLFQADELRITQSYQEQYGIAWAMEGWL